MARRLRLHVVYEHGPDLAPFGAAELRLLRPLTHPAIRPHLEVSFGRNYDGRPVDAVIIDRLISPRLPAALLDALLDRIRASGARLIHAMDDDFLDLALDRPRWAGSGQVRSLHHLLRAAGAFLLTTEPLSRRLAAFPVDRVVVPNALDERLLDLAPIPLGPDAVDLDRPLTLGYMGTFTHADDLAMILPALRALHARQPGRFTLELVGVADPAAAESLLGDLPWRIVEVPQGASTYAAFLPWFTRSLRWDIALAPLADSPFTRCKSDLKHLDYAALGAAGIYSHVPAYSGTVRQAETGWLAPNHPLAWEAGLERLMADAPLRARIAKAARDYLLGERTVGALAPRWLDALDRLVVGSSRVASKTERGSQAGAAATTRSASHRAPMEPDPERARERPPARLQVLYEYADDRYEPHASAHLRLLRPLTHPAAGGQVEPRFRPAYAGQPVEAVILDRLWRPDLREEHVDALLDRIRRAGARLLLALDDNLLDLRAERGDWPSEAQEELLRRLLTEADGALVTGRPLAERLRREAPDLPLALLPNALDERLLGRAGPAPWQTPFGRRPLTIGYMGTATHRADLALILPALRAICDRHPGRIQVELVGVLRETDALPGLEDLPLTIRRPHPADREYTRFLPWFTGRMGWDIALAPLVETPFTRCKSDVKFLDGCALGAAVVCSDMPAYSGTVEDGRTGLLVENRAEAWEDALEGLIAGEERRVEIGRAGRRYLMTERVLARRAGDWQEAILGLIDKDSIQPRPTS